MGAGASAAAKYPTEGLQASTGVPAPSAEGLLTREMLDNLARKNISPSKRSSRGSGFSRSHFDAEPDEQAELPATVVTLLNRIGITTSEGENEYPEQKSRLVGHIFECLGALQSLVNVADLTYDPEMETQSVCERDTVAMGTLLHEMVSIYGLCGDTLTIILASNPSAATIEDSIGRLPLHVACDCDAPWLRTVTTLLEAHPRACRERDGAGRLPLHVVVDRNRPCVDTLRLLLECYPEAAGIRRGVGRLAIHYACFCEHPSLAIIDLLLDTYPTGASTSDLYGRLPLHYLLDRSERPILAAVERLLQVNPDGARVMDTSGKYPLTIALERGHEVSLIRALYDAYPRVVIDAKDPDRSLLHAYVQRISNPRVDIVRYIIYADMELVNSRSTKDSKVAEVLKLCRERQLFDVEREVLRAFGMEPLRLNELRWQARRHALLLAYCGEQHEVPCKSSPQHRDTGVSAMRGQNLLKAMSGKCKKSFEQVVMFL